MLVGVGGVLVCAAVGSEVKESGGGYNADRKMMPGFVMEEVVVEGGGVGVVGRGEGVTSESQEGVVRWCGVVDSEMVLLVVEMVAWPGRATYRCSYDDGASRGGSGGDGTKGRRRHLYYENGGRWG